MKMSFTKDGRKLTTQEVLSETRGSLIALVGRRVDLSQWGTIVGHSLFDLVIVLESLDKRVAALEDKQIVP